MPKIKGMPGYLLRIWYHIMTSDVFDLPRDSESNKRKSDGHCPIQVKVLQLKLNNDQLYDQYYTIL